MGALGAGVVLETFEGEIGGEGGLEDGRAGIGSAEVAATKDRDEGELDIFMISTLGTDDALEERWTVVALREGTDVAAPLDETFRNV